MTYPHNETGAEVEQAYFGAEAEVIEGSRGDCRETLAYLLEIGSELTRNGIQHTTGEAIELVRLAMARTWGWPRRERQQANAVDFLRGARDRRYRVSRRFRKKRTRIMGGFGSGRPSGSGRAKAEDCRSLDVNRLHREDCLRPGWAGGWSWTVVGERVASIGLRAEIDRMRLIYRVRVAGSDWEDVVESVGIVRVACRYGGSRPYFMCPGVVNSKTCGRRVAKLYGPGRYFLCRHCYRLAYSSQGEDALNRALRRANTIRQRLGGDPGLAAPFPDRPKGMWRRTYERLCDQTFEIETQAEEAIEARLARVNQRIEQSTRKGKFWT